MTLLSSTILSTSLTYASNGSEPRIPHYGTGNDGDNTTGLLLIDHEKYLNKASVSNSESEPRIPHYGTGNDGDNTMMCAEKTGGFNLVNYRHSSGVYHEQETQDLHRRL